LLTFFRANSLFHVFSIFVVLALLKIPSILNTLPVLHSELEWMLIGERLNADKSLYSQIWTTLGPLSAYFYGFVHFVFGRGQLFYELMAFIIVFFQSLLFTRIVNNNRTFIERNYLPGLMYIILMSLSFDVNKLSPVLMAVTFLLLAINSLFRHIDNGNTSSERIFEIGLVIGIGSLFYHPFPVFVLWALISLIMFTPVKFNQILLLLLGFTMPLAVMFLFFYLAGTLDSFYGMWVLNTFGVKYLEGKDIIQDILIYSIPVILAVFGIIKVFRNIRYTSFQNRKHQIFVLSGVFGLITFFFSENTATYQLLCVTPFLAFFITGWFIHLKGGLIPEMIFLAFLGSVVLINTLGISPNGYNALEAMRIEKTTDKSYIIGKSILITGKKNDDYYRAKCGSAFVNWPISSIDLANPDVYESLLSIYESFKEEQPEYIIDNERVFPAIFERIPELASKYERVAGTRHYRLKGI
jgi:hypothetical protein